MKKLLIILSTVAFTACGSGDTGEGYKDTLGGHNPNVGPTDAATSHTTGDRVGTEENTQADPTDGRHRPDSNIQNKQEPTATGNQ